MRAYGRHSPFTAGIYLQDIATWDGMSTCQVGELVSSDDRLGHGSCNGSLKGLGIL